MTFQSMHDEIALREASLLDARREHALGELSDEALAEIVTRETAAITRLKEHLAVIEAEVTEDVSPPMPATKRLRKKKWLYVALVSFLLAAIALLWLEVAPRQAGNSITGSISLSKGQQVSRLLIQAQDDIAQNNVVAALSAYEQILTLTPSNVTALTQVGWLDFSAGSSSNHSAVVSLGLSDLREAISLAPSNPAPRLYYAIAAFSTPGNDSVAKAQFSVFLKLSPSAVQRAIAAPYLTRLGLK
jgi:cytochrome c-type biogenesis protein CcmH/NrfG